jgi:glycogen(starch) synthase
MPSAYPPSVGGVEELTRHLALTLRDAGDEVEVWTPRIDHGEGTEVDWQDGILLRRFPMPLPGARPRSWPPVVSDGRRTLVDLRLAAEEFRPDVLHVQCFGPNGAYATALSRWRRVPMVVTLQGETVMDDADIYDESHTLRAALRAGLRQASAVTACSRFTLEDARRFGLPAETGEVVFNGVALDQPSAPPVAGDQRYILAIGRVVDKKGLDLLIRGFARIADRHPDVELRIGGSGPALRDLAALAKATGLGARVRFLGRQDRAEVAGLMAGADCVAMPSRLEPFGIVVLEAWRAGTPVLCTSYGGPPEFVEDGVTGLLVDPFDTEAVATGLDRLLGDAALRMSMGAAGAARVRDFGWPQITEQYRGIYRSLPASPARLSARWAARPVWSRRAHDREREARHSPYEEDGGDNVADAMSLAENVPQGGEQDDHDGRVNEPPWPATRPQDYGRDDQSAGHRNVGRWQAVLRERFVPEARSRQHVIPQKGCGEGGQRRDEDRGHHRPPSPPGHGGDHQYGHENRQQDDDDPSREPRQHGDHARGCQ